MITARLQGFTAYNLIVFLKRQQVLYVLLRLKDLLVIRLNIILMHIAESVSTLILNHIQIIQIIIFGPFDVHPLHVKMIDNFNSLKAFLVLNDPKLLPLKFSVLIKFGS